MKKINILEGIDRTFLSCLEEIMHSYSCLDKQGRLRVEQWVQKLASVPLSPPSSNRTSNFNITWKKHRNAYAKLLLNMITTKHLSPPFSQLPPPGSLQPFPSHTLGQVSDVVSRNSKNLLGPHETSFWRELFDSMQPPQTTIAASSFSSSTSGLWQDSTNNSSRDNNEKENNELSYHGLQLLTREQTIRIKLLETQLREERVQHELLVERLQIQHREEMKSIAKLFEAHNTSDSNVSKIHTAPQQPPQTYPNMFSDISQSYSILDRTLTQPDVYASNHMQIQPRHKPRQVLDSSGDIIQDQSPAIHNRELTSQPPLPPTQQQQLLRQQQEVLSNERVAATRKFRYPTEMMTSYSEILPTSELPRGDPSATAAISRYSYGNKDDTMNATFIPGASQTGSRSSTSSIESTSLIPATSTSAPQRNLFHSSLLGHGITGGNGHDFPKAISVDIYPRPRNTSESSQPLSHSSFPVDAHDVHTADDFAGLDSYQREDARTDMLRNRSFSVPESTTPVACHSSIPVVQKDQFANISNHAEYRQLSLPVRSDNNDNDNDNDKSRSVDSVDSLSTSLSIPVSLRLQSRDGGKEGIESDYFTMGEQRDRLQMDHGFGGDEMKMANEDDDFLRYIETFQKDIETLSIY